MDKIKVVDWISYQDAENKKKAVGGSGGFFENGMRWHDYISIWNDVGVQYIEAIRQSILERGSLLTGQDHQDHPCGVPLFNDDTVGSFTWRAWGDLMAAIWSEKENKDYNYMSFYM